ncbi:MAG TPA: DUF1810 domain-containing protein [Steroidobacteraceae bacterium]|nr:DUF1810 domain-containing protein [Steroidobacteraceae bacterium]
MSDPFNLERFTRAQEPLYARVREELAAGEKRGHWMWFIFPQLAGLGSSAMARRYAIGSLAEARAYLQHPLLGARLIECTALVNACSGRTVEEIFGYPDDLKFRSCMTLFARAQVDDAHRNPFRAALKKYCAGAEDPRTRALLTSACGT